MPYLTPRDAARFLRGVEVMVIEPEVVVLDAGCLALGANGPGEAAPAALGWTELDTTFNELPRGRSAPGWGTPRSKPVHAW